MNLLSSVGLVATLTTVGCAGKFQFAPCPADGGRPWREVMSAHFRVRTDLAAEDARLATLQLERMRTALITVAWPRARFVTSAPMQVVIMRDRDDFVELFGDKVQAFVAGSYAGEPLMVLAGRDWNIGPSLYDTAESTVGHELVHQISDRLQLRQPRWFGEGLASFLETMEISDDGSTAAVGALNLSRRRDFKLRGSISARDTFAWNATSTDSWKLYATSWMIVHWLFNTHRDQMTRFQALLAQGMQEPAAWRLSFPGLDRDRLEAALDEYADSGRYEVYTVPIHLEDPRLAVGLLPDGDVHAARADLANLARFDDRSWAKSLARTELDRALQADPNNLTGLLARQNETGSEAERIPLLRRATAAHPESGAAWKILAGLLDKAGEAPSEVETCYRRALRSLPDDPNVLNNLAWLYVGQSRFGEALPLIRHALARDPGDAATLDTYAHVLAGLGRCTEAVATQRRAIAELGDDGAGERSYQKRLRDLEARCQHSPPATSADQATGTSAASSSGRLPASAPTTARGQRVTSGGQPPPGP